MDAAKVITDFRLLSGWSDTSQITDANALVLANKIYREWINQIKIKVKEDFFYDYWKVNTTVVNQSEYELPIRKDATWVAWCTKLKWVSVKYNTTDSDFTKFRPETQANLSNDLLYYEANQPATDPFYIVADYSYFVYPAPTTAVAEWIVLYWISDPADLLLAWDEASIKIPLEYQDIIPLWMVYLYFKSRLLTNEKNDALNEYKAYLNDMITGLSDRIEVPLISEMPNLTSLK